MKRTTISVFFLFVAIAITLGGAVKESTDSLTLMDSSENKAFDNLQNEYHKNESSFSKRARELHDSISPRVVDIGPSKPLGRKDSFCPLRHKPRIVDRRILCNSLSKGCVGTDAPSAR